MAHQLKRPAIFRVPGFILQLVFGKAAILLTQSAGIIPENLMKENFKFQYPNIELALKEIVS